MADPGPIREAVAAAASAALTGGGPAAETVTRVCRACVGLLSVDGMCVSVMSDERRRETIYASDDVIRTVEELQFTLGEGPCTEAFEYGRPVLVPDLAETTAGQWPVFASMVGDYPVRALFSLPMAIGVIRIGAVGMYRSTPGLLSPQEVSAALQVVDIVGTVLLEQGGDGAGDHGANGLATTMGDSHIQVHQATGMLTVALGVTAQEAFVRLRAYAFTSGRLVGEVADDIVAYRLLLEDEQI